MNKNIYRLKHFITNDPHLRFYINACENPPFRDWKKVEPDKIDLQEVRAFIITYPSGEVLDTFRAGSSLPDDVHYFNGPVYKDDTEGFSKKRVRNDLAPVVHGKCLSHPNDESYYSTTLTNKTNQKIRVYKFAPMNKVFGIFYPSEPQYGYYSPLQFKEWFRVRDEDGWISPNEQVTDPDNWGSGKGFWAYFIEGENGDKFITTASANGK